MHNRKIVNLYIFIYKKMKYFMQKHFLMTFVTVQKNNPQ